MKFREFMRINLKAWNNYLGKIFRSIRSGKTRLGTGALLYPNIALFTETDVHFILELFGAAREFDGLPFHRIRGHSKWIGPA